MKVKILFIILSLSTVLKINTFSQVLSSMSYNIRYDNEQDGFNKWEIRKEALIGQLKTYEPDILGIQEGLHHQVTFIDSLLDDYDYIGIGRDDGITKGEYSAIFYKKEKFALLADSTIWLSENPKNISIGWDASMERICTFGLFKDRESGKRIWIFNTHFDHIGVEARKNSAKLLVEIITDLDTENIPIILTGDFNSTPESKPIEIIKASLDDAYIVSDIDPQGPIGTFNGFKKDAELRKRIDYIFVKHLSVFSISHINERRNDDNFISDHLPVYVRVKFSN